jgi:SAM-dependent methyltransferase
MLAAARQRGVDARLLRIEDLACLAPAMHFEAAPFDLVLSNFGAFNCVRSLSPLREPLAKLLRAGGLLAVCFMNRYCLWETAHYALRRDLRKASRRWSGSVKTSSGVPVFYPSAAQLRRAFHAHFRPLRDLGIGCAVPPSYVPVSEGRIRRLEAIDRRLESTPARHLADHRLLLFRRTESA